MLRLSASAVLPKWSRTVTGGGSLVVCARFFWLSQVRVPPSELELSWLETESSLRHFVETIGFCSRHSARYAVRVKSRCFLLEREADLYTLYNLHCLHTILSPRKVSRSGRLFVSHAMAHLHGSGDLHIPEVEVLIKSLIKKKEKRKEKKKKNIINQTNKKQSGTPRCALKKAASPYGKREFTVSTVMVLTVSWWKHRIGTYSILVKAP